MRQYPPHGQDPRGRELGRQSCLPSAPPPKGKASCVPQSQQDFFPAPARMWPALCLPSQGRGHGVTWAGLGFGPGGVLSPS